jgi:YVTN family beta-propeller protein
MGVRSTGGVATALALTVWIALGAAPAVARDGYVANIGDGDVSVIDTATNASDPADDIEVPGDPGFGIAITPDGSTAYVPNSDETVSVIDTATNTSDPADDIPVGESPGGIAITPDGATAYVANFEDDDVSVIDTGTNTSDPADDIPVGDGAGAIAISPDGTTVYVANQEDGDVSLIDTATNTSDPADDIPVGPLPFWIAITPDGTTAYVATFGEGVSVIDTATNTSDPADDIPVGNGPGAIAITPDGATAYVVTRDDQNVSVIDTASNASDPADDIPVGGFPIGITITPDGSTAYVSNGDDADLSVIDTATNTTDPTDDIAVGAEPAAIAITPNQSPEAGLSAPASAEVGQPVTFDASASSDDAGIGRYTFDFGDGETAFSPDGFRNHTYSQPGFYQATVTVDDGDGCPEEPLFPGLAGPFTGQTAYCNGPSTDTSEAVEIEVTEPPEPTPFELKVKIERPQSSLKHVGVMVSCEGTACSAVATGHIRVHGPNGRAFKLDSDDEPLPADAITDLRPAIPTNGADAARKAFKAGRKVNAIVHVRASAEDGRERAGLKRTKIVR